MADFAFFYGTLMTPFNRPGRQRVDTLMSFVGRGTIRAALFDVGIYPAAIPTHDGSTVWGEVYEMLDPALVLAALDEIEGYRTAEPERSLYIRTRTEAAILGEGSVQAWVYFYNAPLGRAQRIESGDYLEHLNVRG